MASSLLTRISCLACLRRIIQADSTCVTPFLRQIRRKSGRPKPAGALVRLLVDIKGFGKEGSIFRTERGRMRNLWYPRKKAEFMTSARMKELGLTKNDIGVRDPMFGMQIETKEELVTDAVEAVAGAPIGAVALGAGARRPALETPSTPSAPAVEIEHIAPNRALELLTTMIPETIIFERRLKHLPSIGDGSSPKSAPTNESEQPKVLSPLERRRAKMLEAQKPAEPEKSPEALEAERKAEEEELERERKRLEAEAERLKEIHGSVSVRDIATFVKEKMLLDLEASRIHVQPEEIKFLGLAEGVDKVEKLGKFDIEIRTYVGKARVDPIRKSIEVVAP